MSKVFTLPGTKLEVNLGSYARQADGSVWLKCGDNVVLATTVYARSVSHYHGFFPLTVEFRSRYSSVGKIPGGFFKREGKLSDPEVLTSRIIDRSVRPLFPSFFSQEVQVMVNLLSFDGQFPAEVMAVLSASLSLMLSGLPFAGPVGAAVLQKNEKGLWEINAPSLSSPKKIIDQILVVANKHGICMVEANCDFITEGDLLAQMDAAEEIIKKQIQWQEQIVKELDIQPVAYDEHKFSEALKHIDEAFPADWQDYLYAQGKTESSQKMTALKEAVFAALTEEFKASLSETELNIVYDKKLKSKIPGSLIAKNQRFDLRAFDAIRNITSDVGVLPCSHGSAIFTRGETQALCTLTLGPLTDSQKIESLLHGMVDKRFMLHYNFPPYSTGEVKMLRGVGRREIGHGFLAEKALDYVLPSQEEFPYAVRSLVDVLESNGSSSMATVCSAMLAFLDGGVPVKKLVAGIAMGLVKDEHDNFVVFSDITGKEDSLGIMDLKVVGDRDGICAIQMDIKSDAGIPRDVMLKALAQARQGRGVILAEMSKVLSKPRAELKESAPRVLSLKVPTDKIGMIIGPGGKNIKEITAKTMTQVDIADDGVVSIYAHDKAAAKMAESWIRALSGEIKRGACYPGKVAKIMEFGLFVTIVPGKDGLVHISTIDRAKQNSLKDICPPGSDLDVTVTGYDAATGKISLVAPALEPMMDDSGD